MELLAWDSSKYLYSNLSAYVHDEETLLVVAV